jgi:hypothetical protein
MKVVYWICLPFLIPAYFTARLIRATIRTLRRRLFPTIEEKLIAAGFVRVTGLTISLPKSSVQVGAPDTMKLELDESRNWDQYRGMYRIVRTNSGESFWAITMSGEIFITARQTYEKLRAVLYRTCPKGAAENFPAGWASGEFKREDLLERMVRPYPAELPAQTIKLPQRASA